MMQIITGIFVALFGLVTGSFLNVCIFRIPTQESIVFGRSHCMSCGSEIKPYDLIPVASYLILGGKCRSCKAHISAQYPIVELLNAAAWLLLYGKFGFTPDFVLFALFSSLLIIISFIDFANRIIPNSLVAAILFLDIPAFFLSRSFLWPERAVGFFAASVPLLAAALISKGGMGLGDVKLMAAAGALLGYKLTFLSLFAACMIGSVYGIATAPKKKNALKNAIPFGPFLSVSMFLSLLMGNTVIGWYVSAFLHR